MEDRIVKAPIIVTKEDDAKQPVQEPDHITRENVCEKYGYWLHAAVQRWQEHSQTFKPLGTQPVLFIMAEKNTYADAIGEYLGKTQEFGFKESEVLVIHNDRKLSTLDPAAFEAIYDQTELEETFRINLKMEFATTETEVHQADLAAGAVPMAQE